MTDKINTTPEAVEQAMGELTDLTRCRCHEGFTSRNLRDPDCNCDSADAVKIVSTRIKALEAQLAKAMESLRFYAWENEIRLPSEGPWGAASTDFGRVARTTLAAIKGTE